MISGKKCLLRYHQLLLGFVANEHLPRLPCQSRLSTNDKSDNEMMVTGAVQRSPGIYLRTEETHVKLMLRDHPINAVRQAIASNG